MMAQSKRVALCVTCLVDQVYPEIGVAAVQVLRRAGYKVDFPGAQTCCGQPFFNSGFRQEAIDLAKRTVEIFEGYEAVVVPSGSCVTMIRVEYAHLLEPWPEWHRRARELADKTCELSEFLVREAGWEPAVNAEAPRVTYHDSCHMCRLLGVQKEPRQLLEKVGCLVDVFVGYLPGFRFLENSVPGDVFRLLADLLSFAVQVKISGTRHEVETRATCTGGNNVDRRLFPDPLSTTILPVSARAASAPLRPTSARAQKARKSPSVCPTICHS